MCIEGFCGMDWCACAADSPIDDAGYPQGCLGFVACVEMCLYPPADSGVGAGSVTQCSQECGPAYTQAQDQEGAGLLACVVSSCASPSTCGQ
jgi:hypothetical protein